MWLKTLNSCNIWQHWAQGQPTRERKFEFSSWWREALTGLLTPVWS